ncbi:Pyridoxal kinase [Sanguibacter gelidistatuariae]|uniref:pyridoxal kinase n=1 Tax=Sanguibacter gelidistatuariae TaxID=1814289 RepID=A0A1G6H5A2_9MICO|nr:pyridoxal kinase [Sanguibacter gelidistatuariae]SDB89298.1 Pyridoxal kinase [Sanguibacter gelidistatuariae]
MTATIVSIQSQVISGYVGNAAAVPQMRAAGFTVAAVPTVLFSNHPGYGRFRGRATDPELVAELLLGIEEHGVLADTACIVSGYLGSEQTGQAVAAFVDRALAANPDITYVCDPVMGDTGSGVFVAPGVVEVLRSELVSRAHVLTPNQFEAGLLGQEAAPDATTLAGLRAIADSLLGERQRGVVVTGCVLADTAVGVIETIVFEKDATTRLASVKEDGAPNGTGDTFNGALTAGLASGQSLVEAARAAADVVTRALRYSAARGSRDLLLPPETTTA